MSESIDWPTLKLPPINLYNAPRLNSGRAVQALSKSDKKELSSEKTNTALQNPEKSGHWCWHTPAPRKHAP